ncbi:MAG: DUF5684 domain-containing protein [Ignavibacteriaceae bacterium]|nr:DUF5684 domain-containing protein [Ignavibacteriaceae bacterium]
MYEHGYSDSVLFALLSSGIFLLILFLFIILMIVCTWIVYSKADRPGWASIIPIYNTVVLLDIVQKPIWWIILFFIPCVNIVFIFIVYIELANVFGKGTGFGLGLIFLPFIFWPILAFGSAQYEGYRINNVL